MSCFCKWVSPLESLGKSLAAVLFLESLVRKIGGAACTAFLDAGSAKSRPLAYFSKSFHRSRFAARHGGPLTERAVHGLLKRTARTAGINEKVSPHWLRHAHGSHAIDRGASLPEVQATLGHANVTTTSGYLHARPDSSSRLYLDAGIFS